MKTFPAGFADQIDNKRGAQPLWLLKMQQASTARNVAASAAGGTATASSTISSGFAPAGAINGDRSGANWGTSGGWNDGTSGAFPDWLNVQFAGSQTIDTINIFCVQDNYLSPAEPTPTMTGSLFVLTSFSLHYWDGAAWQNIPGGTISGNSLIWVQVTFPPVTTTQIRINISATASNDYSRIAEIEAWTVNANSTSVMYLSDIAATIPSWDGGVTTKAWVSQWGQITEQVSGAVNEIRIADFSVTLIDDPDETTPITTLATTRNLEAYECRLYLWFIGLDPSTDPPQEFFRGYVRDVTLPDEHTVTLTIEDEASRLTANYGEVLTQEAYPTCLLEHVGRMFPVVFGSAVNVMPPVAKVDTANNYYYYVFGTTLSSVTAVRRKNVATGLVETVAASVNNSDASFPGRTVIRCSSLTGTASTTPTTQQATLSPDGIYSPYVTSMKGGNEIYIAAMDNNTGTGRTLDAFSSTEHPRFFFTHPYSTGTKVRGRVMVYVSNAATITITLKSPSGTSYGTATRTGPFTGTLDTGWTSCAGNAGSYWTIEVTFNSYNNSHYYYDAWMDVEYTSTSTTTTFSAAPVDILVDCTGPVTAPHLAASQILGSAVTGTWGGSLPASYQIHGAIQDSKSLLYWLDYLAFQCRCWFRVVTGSAKLVWRNDTLSPVATISSVRVEGGKKVWSRRRAPKTDIINAITLRYNRDYSQSGNAAYLSISSATDSTSIATFGKLANDSLFVCDFITQDQHAQSVRDFYLAALKARYWLEDLEVYLDQVALEFGDAVQLPDGRVGIVVSVGIQPGSIDQMDRIRLTVMQSNQSSSATVITVLGTLMVPCDAVTGTISDFSTYFPMTDMVDNNTVTCAQPADNLVGRPAAKVYRSGAVSPLYSALRVRFKIIYEVFSTGTWTSYGPGFDLYIGGVAVESFRAGTAATTSKITKYSEWHTITSWSHVTNSAQMYADVYFDRYDSNNFARVYDCAYEVEYGTIT